MTGLLGRFELTANTAKTVVQATTTTVCKLNITNPTSNEILASVAITDDVDAINNAAHYIEYNKYMYPNDVLVRDGIVLAPGQCLTVNSDTSLVVAVAMGVEGT